MQQLFECPNVHNAVQSKYELRKKSEELTLQFGRIKPKSITLKKKKNKQTFSVLLLWIIHWLRDLSTGWSQQETGFTVDCTLFLHKVSKFPTHKM